jgi:hypothetical protein
MRAAALLLLALVFACGDDDGSDTMAPADGGPLPTDAFTPVDAPAADSWSSYAMGFFATYCVGCHDGGTRDYRTIDEVIRDQDGIACGVSPTALDRCDASSPSPGQFPVGAGPFPSDAERERLVAWIEAGLPE